MAGTGYRSAGGAGGSVVGWHRAGMNIWAAYDPLGKPGGNPGPRVIVYARRDIPPDSDVDLQLLGPGLRQRVYQEAAQIAQLDPGLTAAVLRRCQSGLKPEEVSPTLNRITQWVVAAKSLPPERKAAAFLMADAYLTWTSEVPQQRLIQAVGAEFKGGCPQDGPAYSNNFRRQAESLDPQGPAGELAGLSSLEDPCSLKGMRPWHDLAIEKAEGLLKRFPEDEWTPWFHYVIARAHAVKLSYAYPGGDPEGDGLALPLKPAEMLHERAAAIEHFREFLEARPDDPQSVFAWQETWRLLAGLPPSMIHFGCSCE